MINPLKSAKYVLLGFGIIAWLTIVYVMSRPQLVEYLLFFETFDVSTPEKASEVLSEFTDNTGVSFPQSTYLLNAAMDHSRDPDVCLKIRVKPEALDAFLKDTTIKKIDLYDSTSGRSYPGTLDHHELRWWQVSKVKNWKTGEIPLPNGASLVILIDYDHTDEYIIYLTWGFV